MEVDELEVIAHLLLLNDLVAGLGDLLLQVGFLLLVLFDLGVLLRELLLEVLFDALGLYFAGAGVLAPHQDFSLEIEGVLSDFGNRLVRFLQDGLGVWG